MQTYSRCESARERPPPFFPAPATYMLRMVEPAVSVRGTPNAMLKKCPKLVVIADDVDDEDVCVNRDPFAFAWLNAFWSCLRNTRYGVCCP